jgi:hypothetical protein
VVVITEHSMDNVVLFPKTIDYYEQELTKFLQTEQYSEALQLLTFLLQFQHIDSRKSEQWNALLGWLNTIYPEVASPLRDIFMEEEPEEDELLRQYVTEKAAANVEYPDKLMNMLLDGTVEQQMIALEQLAYVDHPDISTTIRDWVTSTAQHPQIQFKALQTLKIRGDKGILDLPKKGGARSVDIEETPLTPEQHPGIIRDMIRRVEEISEADTPDFHFFAEQTWNEFLAVAYGTSIYTDLLKGEEGAVDVWASALHAVLQETLFGKFNRAELMELYGITEPMQLQWKQAFAVLSKFTQAFYPSIE